ncbi:MAG TPA: DUF3011 domain-containing protein [Candidatus Competibacteraceae bacterium]|nr:DUF3011 domain-containing protein [Candidatus Competibacteraceae bacterium]
MLKSKFVASALLVPMLVSLLPLRPAQAQDYIDCESRDGRQNYCRADTRDGVRLARQYSKAACIEGQSWGYDRGGVWVDQGCRARFDLGGGYDDWRGRTVTCESHGDKETYCRADTRGGVRLVEQLSRADCTEGQTWGYDRSGIWVDRGCRARFVVGQGYGNDYYGGGSSRPKKDDDDGFSGKDIATAAAVIGGIALLGSLFGGGNQSAPPAGGGYGGDYSGGYPSGPTAVPSWAVGSFRGYNPQYRTNVELNISPDGRVVGYANGKQVNGYYANQQLVLDGNYVLNVTPEGNGFRTSQPGYSGNQVYYQRVR